MKSLALLTAALLPLTALAQNTTQEFYLRTQVKPGQAPFKASRFDNLWLYAYHTGAGTNDAVLSANRSLAIAGFLVPSADGVTLNSGAPAYGLQFDLADEPYALEPDVSVNLYAAWQPVRVNVGEVPAGNYSAFYVDGDGLEWTNSVGGSTAPSSFAGWLVCDWWHADFQTGKAAPQLFFRVNEFTKLELESCADVDLVPEYI